MGETACTSDHKTIPSSEVRDELIDPFVIFRETEIIAGVTGRFSGMIGRFPRTYFTDVYGVVRNAAEIRAAGENGALSYFRMKKILPVLLTVLLLPIRLCSSARFLESTLPPA